MTHRSLHGDEANRKQSGSDIDHQRSGSSTWSARPELIIDRIHRETPASWQIIGLLMILVTGVTSFVAHHSLLPWVTIAIAAVIIVIGSLRGNLPRVRPHPAWFPSLLVVLGLPSIRIVTGARTVEAFTDPFIYAIALAWMCVWFVRSRWALYIATIGLLLLFEYYLATHLPGGRWRSEPLFSSEEGLPAMLHSGGLEYRVLLILIGIVLIAVFSQARVERKRWRDRTKMPVRFINIAGLLLGTAGLLVGMIFPQYIPVDTSAFIGMTFGISIAARQRLIQEDPTRHPERQPTPVKGWVEESVIIVQSVTGTLRPINGVERQQDPGREIVESGGILRNPYTNPEPQWRPVCLHMHSNRWEGKFDAQTVITHFQRIGASQVILTDHNRITRAKHPFAAIPAYEHGWGPHNKHVLVLNASRRIAEKQPFPVQNERNLRRVSELRKAGDFLILAHPRQKRGWSTQEIIDLDYDGLEVFNKSIDSFRRWDEALSNGRLVWGTAGDDCHDLRSRHQTGKRYLLVDFGNQAPEQGQPGDPEVVLDALKNGRFIAVRQMSRDVTRELINPHMPIVTNFDWDGQRLRILFNEPVERMRVYGQFKTKQLELHREREVEITPKEKESYARLVIEHHACTCVFNPIARVKSLS